MNILNPGLISGFMVAERCFHLSGFRLYTPVIRNYSSGSGDTPISSFQNTPRSRILAQSIAPNLIFYDDSLVLKNRILEENRGKPGIYMWTNKITGDIYIGQAVDLANRLKRYFHENYLEKNKSFLISRASIDEVWSFFFFSYNIRILW